MEYRVVRPDGRQVWVAANGRSRFGPQGQIIGMAGVVMDITARKRDAAELERARAEAERGLWQWQAVIRSMTEGLVLADIDGNLISMNPAALAIHEIASLGEMRKKIADYPDLFELHDLTGKHLPLSEWPISRVLRGERFSGYEVRVRRRDTGRQWVGSYGGTPVLDASGRLVLAVLTLRDVTEQRNTEDARRALLAQVEQQARVFDGSRLCLSLRSRRTIPLRKQTSFGPVGSDAGTGSGQIDARVELLARRGDAAHEEHPARIRDRQGRDG
jgi:PAS domain-containing protein